MASETLFTIGHSKRTIDELVSAVRAYGVRRIVDVRKMPRSRTHPQFNEDTLPGALAPHGIAYAHLAALGGLRPKRDPSFNDGWTLQSFRNYADYAETPEFAGGLNELLALAAQSPCAVMCAEVLWWRCHRRIITDYALHRGHPVVHIVSETKSEPAVMTPFAEAQPNGTLRYRAR